MPGLKVAARGGALALVVGALAIAAQPAAAAAIYVINEGVNDHDYVKDAVDHLTSLGHSVAAGDTLGDYSGYHQVWDLRYDAALTEADRNAMAAYLAGGGRMYLSGEDLDETDRNDSLIAFVDFVGGGALAYAGEFGIGEQTLTADGQLLLTTPNPFSSLSFSAALLVSGASLTQGFLVTSDAQDEAGSLVGWDFGDMTGAPDARMLIGWDMEIFGNGPEWTANMFAFLAADAPEKIAEPEALLLLLGGVLGAMGARRRIA